jgi:transcriptional regulator with XRE-family HTH domain
MGLSVWSERLRDRRKKFGESAELIANLAGMTGRTLYSYERGTREPQLSDIISLARVLRTSVAYLIGETDNPGLEPTTLRQEDMKTIIATVNSVMFAGIDSLNQKSRRTPATEIKPKKKLRGASGLHPKKSKKIRAVKAASR